MIRRLRRLPHRVRPVAPALIIGATVLTMATGAGAATLRGAGAGAGADHRATAAGAKLSTLSLPAPPAPAASAPGSATSADGMSASVAAVPRAKHLVDATLLVTAPRSISAHRVREIRALDGVRMVETVAAGSVTIDGHRAFALGVHPATFRPWTPKLTAASQPLWQSIARGELTASFDMGNNAKLPLGATVPVQAAYDVPLRIGAFASVGMAGVDAIVSDESGHELGLRPDSGILVSAPHADPAQLRDDVRRIVGAHAHATLLREVIVIRDAGEFMTRVQINTILRAAASRIGKPYVWGATGPDSFDCSGLVQWSFAHAGVQMPRVSQQQFFAGPHIPYASALPGDLLFWHYDPTDPTNVDHVAIYAGNGMMIVAPHTGLDVQYVPVPLNNLAGVVRVDPGIAAQI